MDNVLPVRQPQIGWWSMQYTEEHYSLLMEWQDHLKECKICRRYSGGPESDCEHGNFAHDQLVAWEAQQD